MVAMSLADSVANTVADGTGPAATASPSTSGSKRDSRPTIDALATALRSSHVAESSTSPKYEIGPDTFKAILLQPPENNVSGLANNAGRVNATASPTHSLVNIIHDRVWSQGGEHVLLMGSSADTYGDADRMAPAEVEHVDAPFTGAELNTSIGNLTAAAELAGCRMSLIQRSKAGEPEQPSFAFALLRRIPSNAQELLELRIAVVGNVDAGKSSTLGVLTRGGLDDGRGKARVNLFRHKHEIESGRTSSVGMEILGFDTDGQVVMNVDPKNSADPGRKMSWEEVCGKSAKVISFIDLAGHERYLKTTVGGLTGCLPDFVMLMVGANAGLIGMSKEHLGVALALAVPVLVCVTKIDMTPPHILEATLKQLTKILRSPGCRKTPVFVESAEQAVDCALRLANERICPVFQISNVTGHNLDLLRSFLNILPQANATKFSVEAPFKFQLQDVFSVPFVGCVVSGVILSGVVRVGDNLMIGPDSLGQFTSTSVRSIQRKRVHVEVAFAGQSASFALKKIRRNQVRKGMVMLPKLAEGQAPPRAVMTCDAEILCLYHSTTLSIGSCMVLHAASIRQTVKIVQIAKLDAQGKIVSSTWPANDNSGGIGAEPNGEGKPTKNRRLTEQEHRAAGPGQVAAEKPVVRTGDRALLRLQFIRTAEYLEPGLKLITREGKTKLIGVVRAVGQSGPLSTAIIPSLVKANG